MQVGHVVQPSRQAFYVSEMVYVNEQQPWSLVEVVAGRSNPLKMALSGLAEDTALIESYARFAKLATINPRTAGAVVIVAILGALITAFGRHLLRPKLNVPILLEDEGRSSKERRLAYCYTPKELMEKGYEQVSISGASFAIQPSLQGPPVPR